MTLPSLKARAVFSLRSDAEDLFAGSFWSPAFRTSKVRWLQFGGISLRGGGSLAICHQADRMVKFQVCTMGQAVDLMRDHADVYLQVKSTTVVSCPRLTSTEHVQKHTAAAPHICFGSARFTLNDLRGHVGLWTFQIWFELTQYVKPQLWMAAFSKSVLNTSIYLPLDPLRLCSALSSLSACPKSHRKVSLPSSDNNTLSAVKNKTKQSSESSCV